MAAMNSASEADSPERGAGNQGARRPGQDRAAGNDQRHAEHHAPVGVFAKYDPCQQRTEYGFQVEQQRGIGGRGAHQAVHQQYRRQHAAGGDGAEQPRPLARRQPRRAQAPIARQAQQREPQSAAEVQQPGQQDRRHIAQQQLGKRRAGAEQQRRDQRCDDRGMCGHGSWPLSPSPAPSVRRDCRTDHRQRRENSPTAPGFPSPGSRPLGSAPPARPGRRR